jgi:hypothetical protein
MKRIALLLVVLLAGYASASPKEVTHQQIYDALNRRFSGGPVSAVFERYGSPQSQFEAAAGVHVLVWHTDRTLRLHEPITTTTNGTIGDRSAYPWASIPYQQTSTTRVGYDSNVQCEMQVGVKPDNSVDHIGIGGALGACENFMP